jgi:hypothetical protein
MQRLALGLARWIRGFSGQGFGPVNLLGFSYGTWYRSLGARFAEIAGCRQLGPNGCL